MKKRMSVLAMALMVVFATSAMAEKKAEVKQISETIIGYFALGKANLTPEIKNQLRQVASTIPKGAHAVVINGYTNKVGTPKFNQGLADRRADNVGKWLVRIRPNINIIKKEGVIYDENKNQVNCKIAKIFVFAPTTEVIDNEVLAFAMIEGFDKTIANQGATVEALAKFSQELEKFGKDGFQVKIKDYTPEIEQGFQKGFSALNKTVIIIAAVGFGVCLVIILMYFIWRKPSASIKDIKEIITEQSSRESAEPTKVTVEGEFEGKRYNVVIRKVNNNWMSPFTQPPTEKNPKGNPISGQKLAKIKSETSRKFQLATKPGKVGEFYRKQIKELIAKGVVIAIKEV